MPVRTIVALILTTAVSASAQSVTPVPRPFPGGPTRPSPSGPATSTPSAAPAQESPGAEAAPPDPAASRVPDLPGAPPVFPTAEYLDTIDAGSGQRYYLFGTNTPFADIVAYYRSVLKNGGREIYRIPGTHQFDLGRYDDNRMVYPPSVLVRDYAGASTPGYLHVAGAEEKRFRTIIQIVPIAAP